MDKTASTSPPTERERRRGGLVLVELVRLAVVGLAAAVTFELAGRPQVVGLVEDMDSWPLALVLLGVCTGYVVGGVAGRFLLGRVDAAEASLRRYSAVELLAAVLGALAGLLGSGLLVWPVLLFDAKHLTVPVAVLVVFVSAATGLRIGASRGGDLLRFLGATGRLPVTTPASGGRVKIVDTSALIDGRLVDVCRAGFVDGTLIVPRFVLAELQSLADSGEDERRMRGRRGLDVLAALQRSSGLGIEVTDRDYPDIADVDAKLVAMANERNSALITVDGNLGRVAEVQGVKVLNLHALADTLRPPVLPGDVLGVRVVKPGKEAGQGVGYLADGTMVVVEGGRDRQGETVSAEVTSILSNANGRLVFASVSDRAPRLVASAAVGE